jgi:hypothetical protein
VDLRRDNLPREAELTRLRTARVRQSLPIGTEETMSHHRSEWNLDGESE